MSLNYGSKIHEKIYKAELAQLIKDVTGFQGKIVFDISKPDGTLQKLLDSRKITQLGWSAKTHLREGIARTYQWYKKNDR